MCGALSPAVASSSGAMLYGIEATPGSAATDSAVDAVMARVQAYREIKNQIQRARDDGASWPCRPTSIIRRGVSVQRSPDVPVTRHLIVGRT